MIHSIENMSEMCSNNSRTPFVISILQIKKCNKHIVTVINDIDVDIFLQPGNHVLL